MCRILVASPGMTKEEVMFLLKDMVGTETFGHHDGTGECHLDENNNFVVNKWPKSLKWVEKKMPNFLNHLPSKKPTIIHLRRSSYKGKNYLEDTHPFVINDKFAVIHNGFLKRHGFYSSLISKLSKDYNLNGVIDSVIGGYLIDLLGIKYFTEGISDAGVFVKMDKNGTIEVSKTSGVLRFCKRENDKYIISSELPWKDYQSDYVCDGYYKFDANCRFVSKKEKKTIWAGVSQPVICGHNRYDYD